MNCITILSRSRGTSPRLERWWSPPSAAQPLEGPPIISATFAALRHRNFRTWIAADLVSITGTWMQVLAVNWVVLQATGSTAHMGMTILLQTLPALALGPLGGIIADRLPGRPMLIVTQAIHALLALGLAAATSHSHTHLTALYAIAACGGVVAAFEGPIMGRFTSTIVDRASLGNAVSLGSLVNSAGRILGMAVGGVVVASLGTTPLFVANAASFVGVIVALAVLRPERLYTLTDGPPPAAAGAAQRPGWKFLAGYPMVLVTLGLAVVLGSLGRNYQVTMAAMSAGPLHGGAGGYAVLSTAFAVGTVVGGLVAASRTVLGLRTLVGLGVLTSGAQMLSGMAPGVWEMAAVMVPVAAGAVMIDTVVSTRIQLDTPGQLRGRVLGVASAASGAAGAFGAPLLGWLAEAVGARGALLLAGALAGLACVAAAVAMARLRGLPLHRHEVAATLRQTLGLPVPERALPAPALG
jgi:MFS family permease